MWTYLIFAIVLVVGILVANFALSNPELARNGMDAFMGMPPWTFPLITALAGLLVFWMGLKLETDWPEAVGALLVAGALAWAEFMFGWENFELGGLAVVPYLVPLVVFLGLMGYSMARSK